MTIIESLIKLRNDLKLWVTNNLRVKADKSYVDELITEAKTDASNKDVVILAEVQESLGDKVDKEDGKGLSSNDFTTEEKEKLAGLSTDGLATTEYVNQQLSTKADSEHTHEEYLTSTDVGSGTDYEIYRARSIALKTTAETPANGCLLGIYE